MTDYIERNEALKRLKPEEWGTPDEKWWPENEVAAFLRAIPAADVRSVVRGRWMSKEYIYGDPGAGVMDKWVERPAERSDYYAYCSACGQDAGYDGEQSLVLSACCPHCGAWMVTDCHQLEEDK